MHYLNRAAISAPECLADYSYPNHNWDNFVGNCKKELRHALVCMQGKPNPDRTMGDESEVLCAYCEGAIYADGHIEHFRRKNPSHFPELTFTWENLFLSCGAQCHCGHYKDKKKDKKHVPYHPDDLIKPDEHNPENFLYFHSDGEVRIRSGLSAADYRRAQSTIHVFNLNEHTLKGKRKRAVDGIKKQLLQDLEVIESWSAADRKDYLNTEIECNRFQPYATTIKHFLETKA